MRIRRTSRELDHVAREMRAAPIDAEAILWARLRQRPGGAKFRRQHAVGRVVFDFVCFRARLVVEVDGASHIGKETHDRERDAVTRAGGFHVLRFTNEEVANGVDRVVAAVTAAVTTARSRSLRGEAPNFGGAHRGPS